jgi:UPF0288 family protein (methanogenesis marker protein 3)
MEKTNRYAELRAQIEELEAKAKVLEPEVIKEIKESGEKGATTELGKIVTVETKIFTYSETLQRRDKACKDKIKEFSDNLVNEIKSMKAIEEKYLTPEIKVGLRFTPKKEEA